MMVSMTTSTIPRPAVRTPAPSPAVRSFDAPTAEVERRITLAKSEDGLAEAALATLADIREG